MVAAKPERGIFSHVDCHLQDGSLHLKPLFTGKPPSYLYGHGIPHLVYHHRYQNRLPTQQELHQWFIHPQTGVGSLGGYQGLAWIDFDTKGFGSPESCDQAIAQWLEQHPRLKDTFTERTHSGGWRFAIKLATPPNFTNFALTPGGEHVGEVLSAGRFTVLAPTIGPSGNPYASLRRAEPVEIENLSEIGLFSASSRQAEQRPTNYQPKPPLPPLRTLSGHGAIDLADLVTTRMRDILDGQDLYQDESMSLVTAARELYGGENWAFANGVPLRGDRAEALIHRVGDAFGYDDDKLRRCLALVNPDTCQPASIYRGDETALWKRVRRLDRVVFEACCPTSTQIEIAKQIEAYGRSPHLNSNPSDSQNPTLIHLRDWYRIARALEAPESTLEAIKTIGQRVAEGKPMLRKHQELMQQQVQSYWQQVDTVIQQAGQILKNLGQQDATGAIFAGQTYRLEQSCKGSLQISAHQRGLILSMTAGNVQSCQLRKADFDRFSRVAQSLSQHAAKIPQLEMA